MSLLDQIINVESGGNPNARNPRSSAGGLGQFIDSTWLDMLAKHRPDIKGSTDELIALKSDPALSRAMTEAYARDNEAVLSGAGLPVDPGTQYLAHFAGPQGAVKVLQADPNAPIGEILGQKAVAANPFLKGMTAADLQAWAAKKMNVSGQPPVAAPQPQPAPVSPAAPPQAIAGTPMLAPPMQQAAAPRQSAPQEAPSSDPGSTDGLLASSLPPLRMRPRKPPDLRALQAAFARPSGGLFFGKR